MYDTVSTFVIHMRRCRKIHLRMSAVSMKHQHGSFCSWLIHQTSMQLQTIFRLNINIFCLLLADPGNAFPNLIIILIPGGSFQCLTIIDIQFMSATNGCLKSHISNSKPAQKDYCYNNTSYDPHLFYSYCYNFPIKQRKQMSPPAPHTNFRIFHQSF